MPNDAKFGLVVGVGLVIAVAVVFFRKDDPAQAEAVAATTPGDQASGQAVTSAQTDDGAGTPGPVDGHTLKLTPKSDDDGRSVPAVPASKSSSETGAQHITEDGDTLYSLAERYYGDGDRFIDIYRANRNVLKSPERLPAGTMLRIP